MIWKVIVEDDKVNLFPFIYWPDAYSSGWREIIGRNLQNTLLEFKNSKFRYFIDKKEWREIGELVFSKIKNTSFGEELVKINKKKVQELYNYCKQLSKTNFSFLSNMELKKINEKYSKKIIEANRVGLFISIIEYDNNILSDYLESYIKNQVEKNKVKVNVSSAFATLITPLKDNYMQQELEKYHDLVKEFKSKKELVNKSTPDFFEKIRNHTKKYCWIRYNYEGPAFTEKGLLQKIVSDVVSNKAVPERKSKEKIQKEQEKMVKKLKIDKEYKRLFSLTREYMYWKTLRRDIQSFAFFVFEAFQKEFAKRFSLSLKEVRQLHYSEVSALLDGNQFSKKELQNRKHFSIYLLEKGKTKILSGPDALKKAKEIKQEELDKSIKVLKGNCAMPGRVVGIAKVINKEEEFLKLEENDILVSFATTPDMSVIIKKAAAIVTDQGGITCHAAIISRELKIPCVVGTKIATKIILDGEKTKFYD